MALDAANDVDDVVVGLMGAIVGSMRAVVGSMIGPLMAAEKQSSVKQSTAS